MNRIERRATLVLILGIALLCGPSATAEEEGRAERTRPSYRREEVRRPEVGRPTTVPLPRALRVEPGGGDPRARRPAPAAESIPRDALEREATRAASWAAAEIARSVGRLEYYRVGFHAGLRTALADEELSRWDYREGVRMGDRDPQARRIGAEEGAAAASEAASTAARKRAERQFLDLGREPRFLPFPPSANYEPAVRWSVAPTLGELFVDVPVPLHADYARRFAEAFRGFRLDPWGLYECDSYTSFFDAGWSGWSRGFDLWFSDPVRSRGYRALRAATERERFRQRFRVEFDRRIALLFDRVMLPAHDQGFDDGWRYGALLSFEWKFRLGYTEGFDRAAASAARVAFAATYVAVYEARYREAFEAWSRSARPEILGVTVLDGNDDGIVQPGERVGVDYELANYGGAAGSFDLVLRGRDLERSVTVRVDLEPRGVTRADEPLWAVVRAGTPARTQTDLVLALDGSAKSLPLLVTHPLEFSGGARSSTVDVSEGAATVEVSIANRSRKPVDAMVQLARAEGYSMRLVRPVGLLQAGESATARFRIEGIRPLDLLSGRPVLWFEAVNGAVVHDGQELRLPELALDLRSDELLRFMLALSRQPDASPREIAEARALMLRRLRVDWQEAVRANGNPYKNDFKRGGGLTALGRLVASVLRDRGGMVRPEVFDGIGQEIEMLAVELPGVHPFLRKYVRKLARRIDRV